MSARQRSSVCVIAISSAASRQARTAPTGMRWIDMATQLPFLDQFLVVASYHNKFFAEYLLGLFGGLLELARLLLAVLLIGSVSKAVRGNDAAGKAKVGLIGVCVGAGVAVLIAMLVGVMVEGAKQDLRKADDTPVASGKEAFAKL